jgi:hypothetical protein
VWPSKCFDWKRSKIDVFQATRIGCRHLLARGVAAFAEGVDAARWARAILDRASVEPGANHAVFPFL